MDIPHLEQSGLCILLKRQENMSQVDSFLVIKRTYNCILFGIELSLVGILYGSVQESAGRLLNLPASFSPPA